MICSHCKGTGTVTTMAIEDDHYITTTCPLCVSPRRNRERQPILDNRDYGEGYMCDYPAEYARCERSARR